MSEKRRREEPAPNMSKKRRREEPAPNIECFEWVPDEILCYILQYLDPVFDVLIAHGVCRRWRTWTIAIMGPVLGLKDTTLWEVEGTQHTRFRVAFLAHHLSRCHVNILRRYLSEHHISVPTLVKLRVQRVLEEGPLDLIKWLHCSQNVELHQDRVMVWMNKSRVELLDWLVDTQQATVTYGLGVKYIRSGLEAWVFREAAATAAKTNNSHLWEWRRARMVASCIVPPSVVDIVLESGFVLGLRDIIEYAGDEMPLDDDDCDSLMRRAVLGNSSEALDLLRETFERNGYSLELRHNAIRETGQLAIDSRKAWSYMWLDKHFGTAVKGLETATRVEAIMRKNPRGSVPFVSYMLKRHPQLVKQLNRRAGGKFGIDNPRSLKSQLARDSETALLRALNDKGCLMFSRSDLRSVVWQHSDQPKPGHEEFVRHIEETLEGEEFVRCIEETLGAERPKDT